MSVASKMMELFSGMEEAHGMYAIANKVAGAGEKQKGQAVTKREPVSETLWQIHIEGKAALGIIPIKKDNTCVWGAIDIDEYGLDLPSFAKRIHDMGLPLFPLRSKSGGCHICLFLTEPVPATIMKQKLAEIAANLGFGKSEIFPKQNKVLVDKGDLGNWLNMPYFGGDQSTRYALDNKGEAIPLEQFLDQALKARISGQDLEAIKIETGSQYLEDGPPCLQLLITQGFPEGTRNNGLFALGVYCRMKYPDDWEAQVESHNAKFMDPPLKSSEVQTLIKQLKKKDYNYKCSDQPLCNYCNSSVCRTRIHGIGGSSLPTLSNLRKIPTDQPVWFLDVNGSTLELNTDQLQRQNLFQKACMEADNFMPPKVNERQWVGIIQALMDECKLKGILDKPKEAGIGDQFVELLFGFCSDARLKAHHKEELLLGRPWTGPDPEDPTKQKVFFRLRDLEEHCVRNNFKYFNRSQITSRLMGVEVGAKSKFFKINGLGVNVWYIEEPEAQIESFSLPDMKGAVL